MTVASETNRSGPYNGNGSTTVFSYGFRILDETHLRVIKRSAAGVESDLVLTTNYTVSGVGAANGGSITLLSAPATGETITILRNVPFTQETDLENQGAYYAQTVEDALDLAAMRDQQKAEELDRALKLPASATASPELPAPLARNILVWNDAATALRNLDLEDVSTAIVYGQNQADIFTGDGATTNFTLSVNPVAIANLDVSVGGVVQLPGTDFTWASGTTLTFTTAPANGVKVLVRYSRSLSLTEVTDGAITTPKLGDGAVTAPKISDSEAEQIAITDKLRFLQSGTGAVARALQAKARDLVSVKDFGAVGDGVTDDTTAIQAAINACANGRLIVPSGLALRVTSQLLLSSPIIIEMGAGSKFKSGYTPVSNSDALLNITSSNVALIGVEIDGQNNDHIGIKAVSVNRVSIIGGNVYACGVLAGISLDDCDNSEIVSVKLGANKTNTGATSLGAVYVQGSNRIIVREVQVTGFYGKSISLRQTTNASITDCLVYDTATDFSDGIYIGYVCENISVSGCHITNPAGNGIKISRGAKRCNVSGCTVEGTTTTGSNGIILQGAIDCTVFGCKVSLNDATNAVSQLKVQPHSNPEGSDCYGNVISGNTFISVSTSAQCILIDDNAVGFTTYDNQINDNFVRGGSIGINTWSLRTRIAGNNVSGSAGVGISVRGVAANSDISGNTIKGNTAAVAIQIDFGSVLSGVNVSDNRAFDCGFGGINITRCTRSNFNNNILLGTGVAGSGITVDSTASDINICGNYIYNWPIYGVSATSTTPTGINVSNNQFEACTAGSADVRALTGRVIGNIQKSGGGFSITNRAALIHYGNVDKRVYVTTPDGTKQYAISVDNAGAVTSTLV